MFCYSAIPERRDQEGVSPFALPVDPMSYCLRLFGSIEISFGRTQAALVTGAMSVHTSCLPLIYLLYVIKKRGSTFSLDSQNNPAKFIRMYLYAQEL